MSASRAELVRKVERAKECVHIATERQHAAEASGDHARAKRMRINVACSRGELARAAHRLAVHDSESIAAFA